MRLHDYHFFIYIIIFQELIVFVKIFDYILGAAMLCSAFVTAFLVFFWETRRFHKVPLREVSLSQRTSVLIVYTDDSKPHSDCIAVLAKILQHDANVDVFLDQFELKGSTVCIF